MASILITGAAGFIGARLGRALSARGHGVVGFDRAPDPDAGFPCVPGDVRDAAAIARVCADFAVERIVHGGGVSGRSVSRDDWSGTIDVNVMGTVAVLEAARGRGIARVVLCSSGSVYGRTARDPVDEDTPLEPVNAYGASKAAAEAVLHAYAADGACTGVALRIFQAFGPGRQTRCNIRTMVDAFLSGRPAQLEFRPDARCQYVHVDDVVAALDAAVFADRLPRFAYNISGGTSLTLREVADAAARALPGLDVRFGDSPLSGEYGLRRIDGGAAERDLGYRPSLTLEEGIRAYAAARAKG